jgi:hypothetical protein
LPLLERARVEAYVPDLPSEAYRNLLEAFDREFTYAFGGCTISRGLDGSYLSRVGAKTPDRINLIYTDLPIALSTLQQRWGSTDGVELIECLIREANGFAPGDLKFIKDTLTVSDHRPNAQPSA